MSHTMIPKMMNCNPLRTKLTTTVESLVRTPRGTGTCTAGPSDNIWSHHLSSTPSSSISMAKKFQSNRFLHHTTRYHQAATADRHGTTIVCVRKNGSVCMMGDGMVSQGSMIVKPNAMKLRRIISKTGGSSSPSSSSSSEEDKDSDADKIVTLVGFAGSTADAFTLLERLEGKLDEYPGQLARSCVELAKGWRTDKYLRRLEASLIVADATCSLELTGNGDVLESHDGVLGVGSGSPYAIAAARALMDIPELSAEDVAKKAMRVASDMCVYTNDNYRVEVIKTNDEDTKAEKDEEEKTSP